MREPFAATAVLAAVLGLAGQGCTVQQTQLLVVVKTDTTIDNPSELHVRCAYDWDGITPRTDLACDRPLVHREADGGPSMELPGTFRVLGDTSREGQALTFVIDDQVDPGTPARLIRVVRVTLPPHQPERLTLTLRAACEAVLPACFQCGPTFTSPCTLSQFCVAHGLTCGDDGTCVSPDVPASALVADVDAAVDGAVAPLPAMDAQCEGGVTDAGMAEGGVTDAARDAARDGG